MPTQGRTTMQDSQQTVETNTAGKTASPEKSSGNKCLFCHGREFKRSRLHLKDVVSLLQFKVPARCVRCGQLQTISFLTAKNALPAGKGGGPTHQVQVPSPVQQPIQPMVQPVVEPVRPAAPVQKTDSGVRDQAAVPDPLSRDAVPLDTLMDVMDIRCQYCPGQAFRRSRLRLQDLFLIVRMRYSARCLRCGQRQTVNFMVAASGVPSSFKQAKNLNNNESWGQFTANSAPPVARIGSVKPLHAVIGEEYTLKDIQVGYDVALPTTRVEEPKPVVAAPKPRVEERPKRADDHSIW